MDTHHQYKHWEGGASIRATSPANSSTAAAGLLKKGSILTISALDPVGRTKNQRFKEEKNSCEE